MEKDKLDPALALTHENVEDRRVIAEIVGWDKVLDHVTAVPIDTDDDPLVGQLVEVHLPDIGTERFLRVTCGTGRKFALPVPPEMQTALEANAWTYGVDTDIITALEVRT